MKLVIKNSVHPVEECKQEVEELITDVYARDYTFEAELDEVNTTMVLQLDAHPEEAVAEFNELYSEAQAYQSRVTSILISAYKEKRVWERFNAIAKSLYRKAKNRLYVTDDDIKSLRNKELQEAAVQEKIPDLTNVKEYIENNVEDLESIISIVKEKKEDLDKANTNLSRQQKVVETLVGIGYSVRANRIKGNKNKQDEY